LVVNIVHEGPNYWHRLSVWSMNSILTVTVLLCWNLTKILGNKFDIIFETSFKMFVETLKILIQNIQTLSIRNTLPNFLICWSIISNWNNWMWII